MGAFGRVVLFVYSGTGCCICIACLAQAGSLSCFVYYFFALRGTQRLHSGALGWCFFWTFWILPQSTTIYNTTTHIRTYGMAEEMSVQESLERWTFEFTAFEFLFSVYASIYSTAHS